MQVVSNPYQKNSFGQYLTSKNSVQKVRTNYIYQFNGMEVDPELKGQGNSYTTEFRQYDPRLGRWLSLDPAMSKVPMESPYSAMANSPIIANDKKGDFIPIIIGGVVIAEEIVAALFFTSAVVAVKTSQDIARDTRWGNPFPGPWSTSRGNADMPNWSKDPKIPNRQTPPNGGSNLAKWIIGTGTAARLVKSIYDKYKDAPKENSLVMEARASNLPQKIGSGGESSNIIETEITFDVKIKVASGDNLSGLAKTYNTTVEQMVKWNNIENQDKISVGQTLKIGEFSGVEKTRAVPDLNKTIKQDNLNVILPQ